jgi:hypothetical protein
MILSVEELWGTVLLIWYPVYTLWLWGEDHHIVVAFYLYDERFRHW